MRKCPRCGNQVEVYNTTCECGFSWMPQISTGLDQPMSVPGEYRPVVVLEQRRRASIWPWLLGMALLGVGGWHVYCSEKLEASIHEYIASNVGDNPADASIEVRVQPITNLVAIELKVVDKKAQPLKPSERLMLDAALSYIRSEVEPHLERELSLIARKQVDPYALVLPYRIAFSLEISSKR